MAFKARSTMVADRHGIAAIAEILHVIHTLQAEEARLGLMWAFKT